MLHSYGMSFDGHLLKRGFWLYIWDIKGPGSRHLYVGRTGDSSSANASSPFRRIGQHLDASPNAKGNALGKQLRRAGVNNEECRFEMMALGPIFPEQSTFADHAPIRDRMAALEGWLADELRQRGYIVLGTHPPTGSPDELLADEIRLLLNTRFPATDKSEQLKALGARGHA